MYYSNKLLSFVFFFNFPLKIDLKYAKELLQRFSELDTNKDGSIGIEEFAQLLGVPNTGYTKALFQLFDEDGDGFIHFKEFISGSLSKSKNRILNIIRIFVTFE